ncbi:MAG: hypothetical protein II744_02450 [Eubacterium sp.]|nr:hypothetical protein [Eubacterium sp.]
MKSDIIHISSDGTGIAQAIKQTEAVAVFKELPKKDAIHLLLLTEEMTGMLKAITGNHDADFWIEDDGNSFYLHLTTETEMNTELRKKLLSASTSGENIAAKGVMGKIKDIFNRIVEPTEAPIPSEYIGGFQSESLSTAQAAAYAKNMSISAANVWSLSRYKAEKAAAGEEWDELEQSVVATIADDIEIGIADNSVEMVISKKF